jgi:hypothetical protein
MSNFTASVATKTVVTGVTVTLADAETVERFKEILTDAANYGPMDAQPLARDLLNYIADKESAAQNGVRPLVDVARDSAVIRDFMVDEKRIQAIKELRTISGAGLKEAKDAIDEVYPRVRTF